MLGRDVYCDQCLYLKTNFLNILTLQSRNWERKDTVNPKLAE